MHHRLHHLACAIRRTTRSLADAARALWRRHVQALRHNPAYGAAVAAGAAAIAGQEELLDLLAAIAATALAIYAATRRALARH
jgi:hypothetical protein